jgi:hypothetical protein
VCGPDIEVPLIELYSGGAPIEPAGVLNAARMSTPGAVTSGFITPGTDGSGPRELNAAITSPLDGDSSVTSPPMLPVWPLPPASHAFSVTPSA